jgi:uncharacterized protein
MFSGSLLDRSPSPTQRTGPIPARAGIGLRAAHYRDLIEAPPLAGGAVHWLEIHAENYFGAGGPPHAYLRRIRRDYPLSVHGVSLSLGSATPPDPKRLAELKALIARYEPALISEHLAWTWAGSSYLADLLPLPYTQESLDLVCRNIEVAQAALGRPLLIENPSVYLRYRHSTIPEPEFLTALVKRTGCGILLDVNNIYVCAHNVGLAAQTYFESIPADAVGEIHLAGHHVNPLDEGGTILIDDHGSAVAEPVWALYRKAIAHLGPRPTLIEWDSRIPAFEVLRHEASLADRALTAVREPGHARAR